MPPPQKQYRNDQVKAEAATSSATSLVPAPQERRALQLILAISRMFSEFRGLQDFCAHFADVLKQFTQFDWLHLVAYQARSGQWRSYHWRVSEPEGMISDVLLKGSIAEQVWKSQEPMFVNSIEDAARYPSSQARLREIGMESICATPLKSVSRALGVLAVCKSEKHAFSQSDVDFMVSLAPLLAFSIESALNQEALRVEVGSSLALQDISRAIVSAPTFDRAMTQIAAIVRESLGANFFALAHYDADTRELVKQVIEPVSGPHSLTQGRVPLELAISKKAVVSNRSVLLDRNELEAISGPHAARVLAEGVRQLGSIPLVQGGRVIGALNVGRDATDGFSSDQIAFLEKVGLQIAPAARLEQVSVELHALRERLRKERQFRNDAPLPRSSFQEIVGESRSLKAALAAASIVAPTGSTVLILGETGTGKELIAHAIHRLSTRSQGPFIKLNCAAIPTGLLESELFGHEKGAFTGAISQKVGRLEMADNGTLLLDEVGDIPLELQPKLLRVLQDYEFERLGGNRTIRVNVRLLAATNKDLAEKVADGEFRSDLYYRLNVFPISVPALRERGSDIPHLIRHFVQKYAHRMGKTITTIPEDLMMALCQFSWPGNVRELEHFIERSVILSTGNALMAPVEHLKDTRDRSEIYDGTLQDAERGHILRALRECGGVIAGTNGAAAKLGMKRTTLQSRMQKHGIGRHEYQV